MLNDYKQILSPIRYLPQDVLGEIFLHTNPDSFVVFNASSPPWVLGHICKDWRNAVVSMPSLWSHMLLRPQNHVRDPVNLMRTALTRSSNHLLTIRYDYWPDRLHSSPHTHNIFSLLTTQSYRWKKACLGLPLRAYHLLAPMQDHLNCLQILHLKHAFDNTSGNHATAPTSVDEITVFESARNLKTVQLFDLPSTSHVRLPWPQLVNFCDDRQLAGTGLNQYFLDGLEAGKNLDMMGVIHRPSHNNGSFPVLEERIVNTALKELHVCDGNFLCSIKLPNLTAMSLEPHFNEELTTLYECTSNALQALHNFVLVSKCPLRYLFLISVEQGDGERLIAILDLTSSTLRELALIQHFTNVSTFPGLCLLLSHLKDRTTDAKGNRQCAIAPHLSELSINLDRVFPTADLDRAVVLLVEVLMARRDCHEEPSLRSIILKGKCSSIEGSFDPRDVFKLTPKQVAQLKVWESQGLNISISVIDDGETFDILHNVE
ncbi:hypothetical protein EDD85DRAFT_947482 [Armillaria nabsnona]|nr:hypothetical protein EDD85DRAFT_947482 [Armillaria nabsnona]